MFLVLIMKEKYKLNKKIIFYLLIGQHNLKKAKFQINCFLKNKKKINLIKVDIKL